METEMNIKYGHITSGHYCTSLTPFTYMTASRAIAVGYDFYSQIKHCTPSGSSLNL